MERSRSFGHVPIVQSPFVQERLRTYRVFAPQATQAPDNTLLLDATSLTPPSSDIRWVIAFDGSSQEVEVREEFPSTRIGYIQVAGVLTDLRRMLSQDSQRFVDPAVIHDAAQEALHSIVVPGSNVCRPDMPTVRDSWRAEVYEVFREYRIEDRSPLDVFMLLVSFSDKQSPGGVILARCAADEACSARDIEVPRDGRECPTCHRWLYPTDALRIHEEVSEEHGNSTALGRLMTCLEQVTMVGYLDFLGTRRPEALATTAFVTDGPLAIFGPQAWLHQPVMNFVQHLVARVPQGPVIVGVEKTGQFPEHARAIADHIGRRQIMALSDDYIYSHVLTFRSSPNAPYGRDTYYGQKFFYRTAQGCLLTISVPKVSPEPTDRHNPRHYPLLPNTLGLLDRIGTSLYEHALIPVALAHSFASIPLRTGSKVLTLFAQEGLGL
jgi:hypothetical protein